MSKVLIIGAGGVGAVVAHKCASVPEVFTNILLASRTKSKCDKIAADVGGNRIQTAQVNADNVPELPPQFESVSEIAVKQIIAIIFFAFLIFINSPAYF